MSKDEVQRPRHARRIQRLDEQPRVPDLPAAAAPHEAPKLLLVRSRSPRRLLLQRAERSKLALGVENLFGRRDAERADELVLQVFDADVEAERLHPGAGELRAEAALLQSAPEVGFLRSVAKTGEPDVEATRAEQVEEASDRLRTADRYDGHAGGVEILTPALGERFERSSVARSFDEDDCTRLGACRERMCSRNEWRSPRATGF